MAAVLGEGVQFIPPLRGTGMSMHQERPVWPNSTPTHCQMTSVIAWAVTASQPFGVTPSHCFSNLGNGRFVVTLSWVTCCSQWGCTWETTNLQVPECWSHPSLVCCSHWVVLVKPEMLQSSRRDPSVPAAQHRRVPHGPGLDIRASGMGGLGYGLCLIERRC